MTQRTLLLVVLLGGCSEPPTPPVSGSGPSVTRQDGAMSTDGSAAVDADESDRGIGDAGSTVEDAGRPITDEGTSMDGAAPLEPDATILDATVDAAVVVDAAPEPVLGPERYPAGRIHSPITAYTRGAMADVAAIEGDQDDHVFMKIGASSTVSPSTLHCFAGDTVDLGDAQLLQTTLDYFLEGDADGATPFDRVTVAARVGHSAGWAITGDPSPIDQEIAAIHPRLAIVHYGTNDMALVGPYRDGLVHFYGRMMRLIEGLMDQGVVPILTGITRRGDNARANRWVHTFNAAIRGMAQDWQIPFIDLHLAVDHLDRHGLAGDGLHLNGYRGGACLLTEEGLEHGYNVRNLIVLESLDRVRRSIFSDEDPLDVPEPPTLGDGTSEAPYEIQGLPFADARDTTASTQSRFDEYACDDADESGPEYIYRFRTDREIRLRAVVLDREGVDIDLHVLDEDGVAEACLDRGHHEVAFTAAPGTYHFALDSFVNGDGEVLAGHYLFLLVECDDDDEACAAAP